MVDHKEAIKVLTSIAAANTQAAARVWDLTAHRKRTNKAEALPAPRGRWQHW